MDEFLGDIKHSIRMFLASPAFTITAVATIALGIGSNTAIFSIVNAVLLKPVPFPYPDRLVMLMNTSPQGPFPAASPARFQHWHAQTSVLEDVAAFRNGLVNYLGGDVVEQLRSAQVSADYFRCFGTPIVRGRAFTSGEDVPGGPKLVLISYNLWIRRFAGDPQVVGKSISLDHEPYTVIGIVGEKFDLREFGLLPTCGCPFSSTRTRATKSFTSSRPRD